MRRFLLIVAILTLCLYAANAARAQATVEVTDAQVAYRFGEQVNFQATLKATAPITTVDILFRAEGESSTRSGTASIDSAGHVSYQYLFQQGALRPFAPVDFWFHVTLQGGEKVETSPSRFYYNDNRFPWKTIEDANIRLHWYTGDDAFAQQARDIARNGLQKTSTTLSVTPSHPLDVYIYALTADLQSAMQIGEQTLSLGGEASPDLGVALVAVSPGLEQGAEMETNIPHELAHLLTYELVGPRYSRLPLWLREGIAAMAEPADPDYAQILSRAQDQDALLRMSDLCDTFPPEMSRIYLAYAQSESFARFIVNNYGDSGLVSLVRAYADGLDCQQGPFRALGKPLDEVEREWHGGKNPAATPNETGNAIPAAFADLLPYLVVLGLMFATPLGFMVFTWRRADGRERP